MEPRPPLRHRLRPVHWLAVDAAAATGYAALADPVVAAEIEPRAAGLAALAAVAAAVIGARRFPLPAAAVALAVFWASPAGAGYAWLAAGPLAYALYRVTERHRPAVAVAALAVALTGPVATALPVPGHAGGVLPFALLLVSAWTAGLAVAQHRRYTESLLRQRELAAAERARRELGEQRVSIARELHDVVAHGMSVIAVQAAYGRLVAARQPGRAGDALAVVEATGRETLAELRRVLDVLRADGPPEAEPVPSLDRLDRLIERASAAGVTVTLTVSGEPRALPAGLDAAAYRIVQEALTNVARHAGTDRARVTVGYEPDGLILAVTDAGRGGTAGPDGYGILGMRERVALYGGTLAAGPRPGGGFAVTARVPVS